MNYEWTFDDGDWRLTVDGEYYGLVCTHHGERILTVHCWGDKTAWFASIDDAKRHLEKCAAADAAANRAWEDTYSGASK